MSLISLVKPWERKPSGIRTVSIISPPSSERGIFLFWRNKTVPIALATVVCGFTSYIKSFRHEAQRPWMISINLIYMSPSSLLPSTADSGLSIATIVQVSIFVGSRSNAHVQSTSPSEIARNLPRQGGRGLRSCPIFFNVCHSDITSPYLGSECDMSGLQVESTDNKMYIQSTESEGIARALCLLDWLSGTPVHVTPFDGSQDLVECRTALLTCSPCMISKPPATSRWRFNDGKHSDRGPVLACLSFPMVIRIR